MNIKVCVYFFLISFVFSSGNRIVYNTELSTILTRLWTLDANKAVPGRDYNLNLQGYVTNLNLNGPDWARSPLFKTFNESFLFNKPTYKAFKSLLDNYDPDTEKEENENSEEKREIEKFLSAILETTVIKEAYKYLVFKKKFTGSMATFKNLLYKLWFYLYKRTSSDKKLNSSGFEHVFVGELRNGSVLGFHNWIQFYLQEKAGNINYRGYFRRGTTEELESQPHLMVYQFIWKEKWGKPLGTSFIGCSPEFEIAAYTIVHTLNFRTAPCVQIDKYKVEMITRGHGRSIGTAYPRSLAN